MGKMFLTFCRNWVQEEYIIHAPWPSEHETVILLFNTRINPLSNAASHPSWPKPQPHHPKTPKPKQMVYSFKKTDVNAVPMSYKKTAKHDTSKHETVMLLFHTRINPLSNAASHPSWPEPQPHHPKTPKPKQMVYSFKKTDINAVPMSYRKAAKHDTSKQIIIKQ